MVIEIHDSLKPLAVPIGYLKPDPDNARTHPTRNTDAIRASLRRFGQRKPVVANRYTGYIEAGNETWRVMAEEGSEEIAAVLVEEGPEAAAAFAIADNRTAELASWDGGLLTRTLDLLVKAGDDLGSLGFEESEVEEALARLAAGEGIAPSASFPALSEATVATENRCPRCGHEWAGSPR